MKRLLSYMKAYRTESILGPLFKMLEASFELFVPLVVASMIDVGIGGRDTGYVSLMGGFLVLLGVIGLACSLTAQYFAAKAATGAATALRNDLFTHISGLSYKEIDQVGASALITRMTSDINQVQNGINMTLRLLLRSPFVVFGAMVMAFTVDRKAAMVFAVTIPLLCIVVFGIMLISMPLYQAVQKKLDRVLMTTRENLMGIRVIRAFNRQESEKKTFEKENGSLVQMQVFVGKISALLNPVTYVIVNLAAVAVIWVGAERTDAGIITQGQVIALVNYMSQILTELVKMANLIILISKAVACMKRVDGVFELESSLRDGSGLNPAGAEKQSGPMVEFKRVSFSYGETQSEVLTDLSFCAMKGQTVGVIGGTGSGKSTLVNLIPRFYDVGKGMVLVDGRDVKDYSMKELRSIIGVVPQKAVLFKGSLKDNMRWGKADASDEEIWEALEIAQAKEVAEKKGQGLAFMIDQGGRNLSGGQKQRISLARALAIRPSVLILDDTTSAVDMETEKQIQQSLRELDFPCTKIVIAQRISTTKTADKIIVLQNGYIEEMGTHEELMEKKGYYYELVKLQTGVDEL